MRQLVQLTVLAAELDEESGSAILTIPSSSSVAALNETCVALFELEFNLERVVAIRDREFPSFQLFQLAT